MNIALAFQGASFCLSRTKLTAMLLLPFPYHSQIIPNTIENDLGMIWHC